MSKNTSSPAFVLLHGWAIDPENEKKWQPFVRELRKRGLAPTFLPLPGLSTPLEEVWTLAEYVKWLEDKLDGRPVVLLGHSFGGQLSIRYAAHHPEQVRGLILIDSAGLRDHRWRARTKRGIFKAAATVGKHFAAVPGLRSLLYKLARENDYLQASPTQRQTMANVIADEVWDDIPSVRCPTQLLWGQDDRVTPLWMGELFAEKIAGSELVVIEHARHSPHYTHPAQVAEAVARFWSKNFA